MKKMLNKINNIIRFARVTLVGSDEKQFPESQFEYMGKTKDTVAIYPYGMSAKAPIDNIAVMMTVGHEENSVSFEVSEKNRPKDLKEGESVFGNWVTGSMVKFLSNGDIEVTAKNDLKAIVDGKTDIESIGNVTVTAPTVIVNGDVTVNGSVTASGTIQGGAITDGAIDLATHTHTVTTAPGTTGPAQ